MCIMSLHEASMSPGPEVGKHFVGWKPNASSEDMRFWVLQGKHLFISLDLDGVSSVLIYFTGVWLNNVYL